MKRKSVVSNKVKSVKKVKIEDNTNFEDIVIAKTCTDLVNVPTGRSGSYFILVSDIDAERGAHSVFVSTKTSSIDSGATTRLSSSKGSEGQRIDADWVNGEGLKIFHKPAGSGEGNYTYRVKIYSAI